MFSPPFCRLRPNRASTRMEALPPVWCNFRPVGSRDVLTSPSAVSMSSGVDNRVISTVVRHHSSQGAVASMWGWKLHTLAASEGLISADRDPRQRRMPPFVASVKKSLCWFIHDEDALLNLSFKGVPTKRARHLHMESCPYKVASRPSLAISILKKPAPKWSETSSRVKT